MGRINKATGDEIESTEQTAKQIGISYITLRRWLADSTLHTWLAEQDRAAIEYTELANGNRIWRFGNRNRADLRAFRDRDERKREPQVRLEADADTAKGEQTRTRRIRQTLQRYRLDGRTAAKHKAVARTVRRYITVLAELKAHGLRPQKEALEYCPPEYASEFKLREAILTDVKAQDSRDMDKVAAKKRPDGPGYFRREVLFGEWGGKLRT